MKSKIIPLELSQEQFRGISVDQIDESLVTLRTEYDEDALDELAKSRKQTGQLQSIVVQPNDRGRFDLIIGSRRLRAAKRSKDKEILAVVIEPQGQAEVMLIALAENLHREDLNPFEEARAFLCLMKEHNLSIKQISDRIKKSENYVRSRIQIMAMPEEVAVMIAEKKLPVRQVQSLARVADGETQVRLAKSSSENKLTNTELSAMVSKELREPSRSTRASHLLTVTKLEARCETFTVFLQKAHRRINLTHLNKEEADRLIQALSSLSKEVDKLQLAMGKIAPSDGREGGSTEPINHGGDWTVREMKMVSAKRRPSDEELAKQLGRTVGAIKSMRSKVNEAV